MTQRESPGSARSAEVAEALRAEPPALDEVRRARMERRLLEAARRAPVRGGRRTGAAVVAVLAAAAAVALGWIAWPRGGPVATVRFGAGAGAGVAASATVSTGGTVEVGEGREAAVEIGGAALRVRGGALRLGSLDPSDVRLELVRGRIEVAFHPEVRGRDHLRIETPAAIVEVVGTEFSVRIEGGATEVAVTEGTVRVVPRGASDGAVRVGVGQSVRVEAGARPLAVGPAPPPSDGEPGAGPIAPPGSPALAEGSGAAAQTPSAPSDPSGAVAPEPGPAVPSAEDPAAATAVQESAAPPQTGAAFEPPAEPSASDRLRDAERLLSRGEHARAQAVLSRLAGSDQAPRELRVEALTSLGDSLEATGDGAGAAAAFERAIALGQRSPEALNALYQLARLRERRHEPDAAREAYVRYVEARGPLRAQALAAACRLGGAPGLSCPP